jgi:hypothetical protein
MACICRLAQAPGLELASAIPTSADQRLRMIYLTFSNPSGLLANNEMAKRSNLGALETCNPSNVVRDCVTN